MTISFIIAYHNEPLWMLKECISSILAVGIPRDEREIILVDDGSDSSPLSSIDIVSNGIEYVYQENMGLSEARNTALRRAKGRFIQFVDSDDCLIADEYRKVLDMAITEDLDVLLFRFTHNQNRVEGTYNKGRVVVADGVTYLRRNNLRGAACLYVFRREILNGLEFMPGICHEDMLFTPLLLLNARRVADLSSVAYFYRQHRGTIMSCKDEAHIRKRFDDSITVLRCLKVEMVSSTDKRYKALRRVIDQQVMSLVYNIITVQKPSRCLAELRQRIVQLRNEGLYPVSISFYTWKYVVFALLSRCVK